MVRILDCTLRDGGYVNNWKFEWSTVSNIVRSLVTSGVEIIELGYLDKKKGQEKGCSVFADAADPISVLRDISVSGDRPIFCVMVDLGKFSGDDLPQCMGNGVTGIRLAFHKEHLDKAVAETSKIIDKGYKVFVQPMVTTSYSEDELRAMIKKFNALDVFVLYIVDSFGLLLGEEFAKLWRFFHAHLRPDIALGYHGHNNFQMVHANAIELTAGLGGYRELFIDTSIFGMGRGAGNLNTELFAYYLNQKCGGSYDIAPLLECVDNYIESIYRENGWGYSLAFFLSAATNCHPNYANYLINKKTLAIVEVQKILQMIPDEKKRLYSEEYVNGAYLSFRSLRKSGLNEPWGIFDGRHIIVLASGPSVNTHASQIESLARSKNSLVVALNHIPTHLEADLCFFSNQKRYNKFQDRLSKDKLLITSNIELRGGHAGCFVVDYQLLMNMTLCRNENVAILFLNLLTGSNVKDVALAGLDGFRMHSDENYSYQELSRLLDRDKIAAQNESIITALKELRSRIKIEFLTPSLFEEKLK